MFSFFLRQPQCHCTMGKIAACIVNLQCITVNLQCFRPLTLKMYNAIFPIHCKFTIWDGSETHAKQFTYTMLIHCVYIGITVNLQWQHCKMLQGRALFFTPCCKNFVLLRRLHCKTTVNLHCGSPLPILYSMYTTVNSLYILQLFYNGHCKPTVKQGGDYTVKEHKKLQPHCKIIMHDTVQFYNASL